MRESPIEGGVSASPRPPPLPDIDRHIAAATAGLLSARQAEGHWCYELEADATIPAEYVLLLHYLGEEDRPLEQKIATYLRRRQNPDGGWPLVAEGASELSCTVKAYFALKMIGDPPDAPHMARARARVLALGGAENGNVFTRALLALFGEVPWRAVPAMPVEITLLPRWFPFHLFKISYWARTVLTPLLVLQALKPRGRNPRGIGIRELFRTPPERVRKWPKGAHQNSPWASVFGGLDLVLRGTERFFPKRSRRRAIAAAIAFVDQRLNGRDGLGAIFPAMANAVMMYDAVGIPPDDPRVKIARAALEGLIVVKADEAYVQPCVSPVWDTALACHALLEAGDDQARAAARQGLDWLAWRQVLDVAGDWAFQKPHVPPGGWAFQYGNDYYPDLDDTAVIVLAMDRVRSQSPNGTDPRWDERISRARQWIEGLQSRNGAWAAFDADNTYAYLNHIPFADHGALLDPPTADVTARCVSMLGQLGETPASNPALAGAVDWLVREQESDGSWFGRWGMNHIYGTWSVLSALNAIGHDLRSEPIRRAVGWLISIQNDDGGWGEDAESYALSRKGHETAPSTASQTAWALLGLMAAGAADHPAVARGIAWLATQQGQDGLWQEERFTGTGFPRFFYLRYHGYAKYFPLWAMARYRNLRRGNSATVPYGL